MSNTFLMSEIVLSVPALGMPSPNIDGSTSMSGEHITAHIYAVKENEKLLVGRRDFVGTTTSGYDHLLTVIKPKGYQLVVETVDQYGIPYGTSRVRLKLDEVIESGDGWHLNKSGEANITDEPEALQKNTYNMNAGVKTEASELQEVMEVINKIARAFEEFGLQVGQTFINEAFIQQGTIHTASIGNCIMTGHNDDLKSKSDDHLMKNAEELPDSKTFTSKDNAFVFSRRVTATIKCLSDDLREAVIDAGRNSEVFQSLVAQLNALSAERKSALSSLQRGTDQAVTDTIRNALKPGGLLRT